MIIIRVAGGLGNQMQQYAMYRLLEQKGRIVKLDFAWFSEETQEGVLAKRQAELDYFVDLPYVACTEEERNLFLRRSFFTKGINRLLPATSAIFEETGMYHPELLTFTDKYLTGYFLCNKYYEGIWDSLRRSFRFPMHTDMPTHLRNVDLMNEMLERESVSIHIRRGDYLDKENAAIFGGIATDAYYDTAIRYFRTRHPHAHFYLFSNDAAYVHGKYPDKDVFTVVDWNTGKNSLLDMQLMSCCMGNICANSTFSFWGARLNQRSDKEVLRPYRMRNNQSYDPALMHDYWKDWILMDETGRIV